MVLPLPLPIPINPSPNPNSGPGLSPNPCLTPALALTLTLGADGRGGDQREELLLQRLLYARMREGVLQTLGLTLSLTLRLEPNLKPDPNPGPNPRCCYDNALALKATTRALKWVGCDGERHLAPTSCS